MHAPTYYLSTVGAWLCMVVGLLSNIKNCYLLKLMGCQTIECDLPVACGYTVGGPQTHKQVYI